MKITKKLISLALAIGLPLAAQATTVKHVTERMLTGAYLCVLTNTTATITTSNLQFYSYAAGTNILSLQTNVLGNFTSAALQNAAVFPDINADVNPNIALQVVMGYTNQLFSLGVQSPVMINTVWTNAQPAAIPSVGSTNQYTITLTAVSSAEFPVDQSVPTFKTFSVTGEYTNGVPYVFSTNLPTSFLQGAYAVSPSITIGAGTNGTAGLNVVIFNALNLTGWTP